MSAKLCYPACICAYSSALDATSIQMFMFPNENNIDNYIIPSFYSSEVLRQYATPHH
jgi:hypothetical protein